MEVGRLIVQDVGGHDTHTSVVRKNARGYEVEYSESVPGIGAKSRAYFVASLQRQYEELGKDDIGPIGVLLTTSLAHGTDFEKQTGKVFFSKKSIVALQSFRKDQIMIFDKDSKIDFQAIIDETKAAKKGLREFVWLKAEDNKPLMIAAIALSIIASCVCIYAGITLLAIIVTVSVLALHQVRKNNALDLSIMETVQAVINWRKSSGCKVLAIEIRREKPISGGSFAQLFSWNVDLLNEALFLSNNSRTVAAKELKNVIVCDLGSRSMSAQAKNGTLMDSKEDKADISLTKLTANFIDEEDGSIPKKCIKDVIRALLQVAKDKNLPTGSLFGFTGALRKEFYKSKADKSLNPNAGMGHALIEINRGLLVKGYTLFAVPLEMEGRAQVHSLSLKFVDADSFTSKAYDEVFARLEEEEQGGGRK